MLLALIAGLIWFQIPYKEESIVDRYSLVCIHLLYYLKYTYVICQYPSIVSEKDEQILRCDWFLLRGEDGARLHVVARVLFLRKLGQYAIILKTRVINYMYHII